MDYDDWDESSIEYEFKGFIEFENFISTYKDQELRDVNKKNELRNNIKFNIGGEYLQFKMNTNIYLNSNIIDESVNEEYKYTDTDEDLETYIDTDKENKDLDISRNLRLSNKSFEISFYELFASLTLGRFRLRVGNQIYGWGTADAINPTSYFNPMDQREFIFKDEDEMKLSIPSVSGMLFLGDFSFELVFAPIHIPMLMPPEENYWYVDYSYGIIPIIIAEPEDLEINSKNYSYGARLSGTILGTDISISGYHGPDVEPTMRPIRTLTISNKPVSVLVNPEYFITNYIGFDFTKSLGKFVFQCEAAYSPDKTGVVDQGDPEDLDQVEDVTLPFEAKKSHYVSYSGGFNYFIPLNRILKDHEGETVFTIEWHQAMYFNKDLMDPILTDIITTRLEDSFFSSQLKLSVTGFYDTKYRGLMLMPKVGIDFLNGFTLDVSYGYIKDLRKEKDDEEEMLSFLGFYKDKDIVIVEARYEF